ncbi:hypothetical protein HK102_011401, partial [Quaeritorhiza haematococci]
MKLTSGSSLLLGTLFSALISTTPTSASPTTSLELTKRQAAAGDCTSTGHAKYYAKRELGGTEVYFTLRVPNRADLSEAACEATVLGGTTLECTCSFTSNMFASPSWGCVSRIVANEEGAATLPGEVTLLWTGSA